MVAANALPASFKANPNATMETAIFNIRRDTSTGSPTRHVSKSNLRAIRLFLGLRRQSAAATALSRGRKRSNSGVALRFPPQSKTVSIGPDAVETLWRICRLRVGKLEQT